MIHSCFYEDKKIEDNRNLQNLILKNRFKIIIGVSRKRSRAFKCRMANAGSKYDEISAIKFEK